MVLYLFVKKLIYLSDFDKNLILFVIDMYLSYGEINNIFPDEKSKEKLINKINILKSKIENDTNNRK